jgi:chromosome segregation ATPase
MIRQMNAELNQLKSEKQALLTEKQKLTKSQKKLNKKYDRLEKKSNKNKSSMKGLISDVREKYKSEVADHNVTRDQLKAMVLDKNRILGVANRQLQAVNTCVLNNKKLYEINQAVLGKYENKGFWDSVTQAEPFSGLSQVEIENLVDDYQYQLDDLRVESEL